MDLKFTLRVTLSKLFDAVGGQKARGGKKVEYPSNYPVCFYRFDRIGE